ncbi:MAG: hypothetical protein N3G20_09775, partial [Verrucomicrobiae bacterium]|nr:hypothetical protein [Verrucomicrobiae bacterium]
MQRALLNPRPSRGGEHTPTPPKNWLKKTNPDTSLPLEIAIGVTHIVLLVWALQANKNNLNADGIAYLRLASYYADFRAPLMISGYWGPMLSWLTAVWLKFGVPIMIAGRLSMLTSAIVYAWGARALLRALSLPAWVQHAGFALTALCSVLWSIEFISPDLLVGGLICFAAASMLNPDWTIANKNRAISGVLWGMAYLAKAVALPIAFLLVPTIAVLWHWKPKQNSKQVFQGVCLTLGTCVLVALPWIIVLSIHYGKP